MGSHGKKRILIIIENLPAPLDRRVWQEANSLKSAGYEVSIICPKGKGHEKGFEIINDIPIYRHSLPLEGRSALGYLAEYVSAVVSEFVLSVRVFCTRGFDAIQACNPPDLIFIVASFYKFFFGRKFVFDHHDLNPELWLAKGNKRGFFYKLLLLCERLTFGLADVSIAPNRSYKEVAVTRGGMRDSEVFVVRSSPIAKNVERFFPVSPAESLKKGKKYLVGYVGVMGKQDGLSYLLKAAAHIIHQRSRKDVLFVLIGEGPEWHLLKEEARELKIEEYVLFPGRLSDRDMIEYLSAADICVNPDVVNEFNACSTMNKVLEYMILGKPIVQFDMKEGKFSAQDASLYAKPNDEIDLGEKILELLGAPDRRQAMGEFGRQRVMGELSWEYSERELLRVYETLFENANS